MRMPSSPRSRLSGMNLEDQGRRYCQAGPWLESYSNNMLTAASKQLVPPKPRARSPSICESTHFALSPDVENRSENHGHSCDSGRRPPTFARWHSVRPETLCAVGPVEHCSRQHSPQHVVLPAKYNSLWKSTCTRIYAFLSNIPYYPFFN